MKGASASVGLPFLYNPTHFKGFRIRRLPCAIKQDGAALTPVLGPEARHRIKK
jgi:hypothetical protein